jgi:hypothetical protein
MEQIAAYYKRRVNFGDSPDWSWEIHKGETVMIVRKALNKK